MSKRGQRYQKQTSFDRRNTLGHSLKDLLPHRLLDGDERFELHRRGGFVYWKAVLLGGGDQDRREQLMMAAGASCLFEVSGLAGLQQGYRAPGRLAGVASGWRRERHGRWFHKAPFRTVFQKEARDFGIRAPLSRPRKCSLAIVRSNVHHRASRRQ